MRGTSFKILFVLVFLVTLCIITLSTTANYSPPTLGHTGFDISTNSANLDDELARLDSAQASFELQATRLGPNIDGAKWVYLNQKVESTCTTICNQENMLPATSPEGKVCRSGEQMPKSECSKAQWGCWGGAPESLGGSSTNGNFCYNPGQRQDGDSTDLTTACYCKPKEVVPYSCIWDSSVPTMQLKTFVGTYTVNGKEYSVSKASVTHDGDPYYCHGLYDQSTQSWYCAIKSKYDNHREYYNALGNCPAEIRLI